MKKEELEFGNVVELRNGDLCLIVPLHNYSESLKYCLKSIERNEYIYHIRLINIKTAEYEINLIDYNDNLIDAVDDGFSIVKVYKDYTLKELLWGMDLLTNEERGFI